MHQPNNIRNNEYYLTKIMGMNNQLINNTYKKKRIEQTSPMKYKMLRYMNDNISLEDNGYKKRTSYF